MLCAGQAACSARHSCLPAHLPSAHCQRGAAGQRLRLQEATAQSRALWAQLLTPPYLSRWFHTTHSARIILESEGSRGEQSLFRVQGRTVQGHIHVSVYQHFPWQQMERLT